MILKEEARKSVTPTLGQATHGHCHPENPNVCLCGTWLPPVLSTKGFPSGIVTSLSCKWTHPALCFLNIHFQ